MVQVRSPFGACGMFGRCRIISSLSFLSPPPNYIEEDKVNCPFFFKIGACRHGDRCSRIHHKPAFSPTLLIKHIYPHPSRQSNIDEATAVEDFFCFYEDMFMEFSKFGPVEELHVCDNVNDHLIGHCYVKFRDEEQAAEALQVMNGRYYDGRLMQVEFSPVTDFGEARCRDYDEDSCKRGGFCNFLHVKPVPLSLIRWLEDDCEDDRRRDEEERRRKKKRKRDHKEHKHKKSRKHHRRDESSDDESSGGSRDDRGRHSR